MTTNINEQRIAKMARRMAKMIIGLEKDGEIEAAARMRLAAMETANLMRAGRL